jgi:hypothetical protein
MVFINTQIKGGTITLPNTASKPGRIITFKDAFASFEVSSFRLATSNQLIDGMVSSIQVTESGWTTLTAGNTNQWYVTGGTQLNTVTTSNMYASTISVSSLSVSSFNVTTLSLSDISIPSYIMTLFPSSTSLYLSTPSTIVPVAGGPRQSFGTLFLQVKT